MRFCNIGKCLRYEFHILCLFDQPVMQTNGITFVFQVYPFDMMQGFKEPHINVPEITARLFGLWTAKPNTRSFKFYSMICCIQYFRDTNQFFYLPERTSCYYTEKECPAMRKF